MIKDHILQEYVLFINASLEVVALITLISIISLHEMKEWYPHILVCIPTCLSGD